MRLIEGGHKAERPYLYTLPLQITDFVGTRFLQSENFAYIKVLKESKVEGMLLCLDPDAAEVVVEPISHGETTATVDQMGLFQSNFLVNLGN